MSVCNFCFNAHVWSVLPKTEEDYLDPGLDDNNDSGSSAIGCSDGKHQIYFNSGGGLPCNIEICEWKENGYKGQPGWSTIAKYYPKYCPECGRELDEYKIYDRGAYFKKK